VRTATRDDLEALIELTGAFRDHLAQATPRADALWRG
jgi:hypothetical protein